jgi:hypothetical protein
VRRLTFLLAGLIPGLLAAPASAEESRAFQWSLTNDLLVQNNELAQKIPTPGKPLPGPQDGWRQYQESLALAASWTLEDGGSISGGVTARGVNFYQQSSNLTLGEPDNSLYRKYVKFNQGGFSALAGDFYALLGQGLVLSVLPIDKLLKERTISGGDLNYRGTWVEVRALAGKVETETKDQAWNVNGGEAYIKFLQGDAVGIHRIGVHAAQIEDVITDKLDPYLIPLLRKRTISSASLGGDNLGGIASYYVESANLKWEQKPDDFMPIKPGDATYANLTLHPGRVFLMGEYKRYERFETDLINGQNTLNNPPLADREDEKNNLTHSEAVRLLAQFTFPSPDFTVFISGSDIKENDHGPFNPKTDTGHNVYGGFTAEDLWEWLTLSGMYGVKNIEYPERRTDGSAAIRFSKQWSLELKLRDKRYTDNFQTDHRESDYQAQISCSPWFSLSYLLQSRSDPGRNFDSNLLQSGSLRVNLWKDSYLVLSGGSIRGGLVCSGGQCREMPDYKGWKAAAHFVF